MQTKQKVSLILISLIFLTTCRTVKKKSFPEVLNSDEKVVYLEGHDKSSGLYAFYFMDVVIIDPKTAKKFYVTNDIYYDLGPAISADGNYISFISAREFRSYTSYQIQGIGAPSSLYIYNIKKQTMKKVSLDDKILSYFDREGYYFYSDTTEFIYSTKNKINIINIKTKEQRTVKNIKELELSNWRISRNKEMIVVSGYDVNAGYRTTLIVWNLSTGEEIKIPILEGDAFIGDIDTEKGKILYTVVINRKKKKLYEYHISEKKSIEIILPQGQIEFPNYKSFCYTKNGNIIGIATIVKTIKNKKNINGTDEILEYYIHENKFKQLTNDGLIKYQMVYWYKK